jgi:hypothetical protein
VSEFVRFPRTPHLSVDPEADIRDDKVLLPAEAQAFLSEEVIVEEKIDGENLGVSVVNGRLTAQSRGSYVELGGKSFRGLESWLRPRASRIATALGFDLILFGEWTAAKHSVFYDELPDWLLLFDVYDRRSEGFLSPDDRDSFAEALQLAVVPRLAVGVYGLPDLEGLLGKSRVGHQPMEGLVLRHSVHPDDRAKLVRPNFLAGIDAHWRSAPTTMNRLALAPGASRGR